MCDRVSKLHQVIKGHSTIIKHKGDEIEIAILSLNRFDGDKKCNKLN
jgi:hypothetical protein